MVSYALMKSFCDGPGYGFIKCEGHRGVFFHVTEVKHSDIFVGTGVEFEVVGSGKRPIAVKIVKVTGEL